MDRLELAWIANCLSASKYAHEPVLMIKLVSLALGEHAPGPWIRKLRGNAAGAGVAAGPDAAPHQEKVSWNSR